jgi:hypothetical protein
VIAAKASTRYCLILGLVFLAGCDLCKEEVWSNVDSPDGKWTATTVMRDCGATTSEIVGVNVHKRGSKKLPADQYALVMKHGEAPVVLWTGNNTLVLDCRSCNSKDEIARAPQIGPIHVEYR